MDKSINIPITDSNVAARNVVATAIDGETLILKDTESGDHIYWPLKSIPQPLEIGATMSLELKNSHDCAINSLIPDQPVTEENHKHQLLEQLIN